MSIASEMKMSARVIVERGKGGSFFDHWHQTLHKLALKINDVEVKIFCCLTWRKAWNGPKPFSNGTRFNPIRWEEKLCAESVAFFVKNALSTEASASRLG